MIYHPGGGGNCWKVSREAGGRGSVRAQMEGVSVQVEGRFKSYIHFIQSSPGQGRETETAQS